MIYCIKTEMRNRYLSQPNPIILPFAYTFATDSIAVCHFFSLIFSLCLTFVVGYITAFHVCRDVAAAPQTPQLGGGPRPTLGAQVSLKLLFGYVTIFSSADLFTTDLNCRKKLACDIISECDVILSRRI